MVSPADAPERADLLGTGGVSRSVSGGGAIPPKSVTKFVILNHFSHIPAGLRPNVNLGLCLI